MTESRTSFSLILETLVALVVLATITIITLTAIDAMTPNIHDASCDGVVNVTPTTTCITD